MVHSDVRLHCGDHDPSTLGIEPFHAGAGVDGDHPDVPRLSHIASRLRAEKLDSDFGNKLHRTIDTQRHSRI